MSARPPYQTLKRSVAEATDGWHALDFVVAAVLIVLGVALFVVTTLAMALA